MNGRYALILACGLSGCFRPDDGTIAGACIPWPESLMIGTARSDELLDVIVDKGGNVYVSGYTDGVTGNTNIEPSGNATGIVLKFGPNGELLARHVIDTAGADVVEALALHPDSDEVYLVGRTNGSLPGFTNQGQYDLFVGWLGAHGSPTRLAQLGTQRPQHPRRIELGLSNELVISGFDDIYVPSNYVESWEDPLLLKVMRVGEDVVEVWQRTFDTGYPDAIGGLAVARETDGATYVAGRANSGPERGMFVTKFDSQGSPLWHRRQTFIGHDMGAALAILPDGHLLLAGSTFEQLGERAFGQQDVVVRKLDAVTGEALWTVQYGSAATDWVTDMALDPHGQIYVVGETLGSVEPGGSNRGGTDAFLMKLDADGQLIMARQWGSGAGDYATAVAADVCERAFVVGYTAGNLAGTLDGARDGFIIPVMTHSEPH